MVTQSARSMADTSKLLVSFAGKDPGSLLTGMQLKQACEDFKAFYIEAASDRHAFGELTEQWFWTHTQGGKLLRKVGEVASDSEDESVRLIGSYFTIPWTQLQGAGPTPEYYG